MLLVGFVEEINHTYVFNKVHGHYWSEIWFRAR